MSTLKEQGTVFGKWNCILLFFFGNPEFIPRRIPRTHSRKPRAKPWRE